MVRAGPDAFDGISYAELPINSVDWEHRGEYIRTRSARKGSREFDVQPEWATQAALDPAGLVGSGGSLSGETIKVIGYSRGAGRILTILLIPKDKPTTGDWWGVNAWACNDHDLRAYREKQGPHEPGTASGE